MAFHITSKPSTTEGNFIFGGALKVKLMDFYMLGMFSITEPPLQTFFADNLM